jgi:hypothetical protein
LRGGDLGKLCPAAFFYFFFAITKKSKKDDYKDKDLIKSFFTNKIVDSFDISK